MVEIILRICLPALLWTIVAIAAPVFIAQIHRGHREFQEDFAVYYFSALEMRQGRDPYTTNFTHTAGANGFHIHSIALSTDPPTFVSLFEILTVLPLPVAYLSWQVINLVCFALSLMILIGLGSGLDILTICTLTALIMLYPPIAAHFWFGQSKFPVLLLCVLMMRSLKRGRGAVTGIALASAALMHIFPIVLSGYLVLTRNWRALGWTSAALIFGIAITVAFTGLSNCLDFVRAIPSIGSASWNIIQRDLAAPVFFSRQLRTSFPHAGSTLGVARFLLMLATDLIILGATTLATLALPENTDPDSRIFSLWVATAVFLLPVAWDYDLILMLIPFAQLAVVTARGAASKRSIAMAVLSYALLVWWEYVALSANEFGFFAMLTAYLSAYWLAIDQPDATRLLFRAVPAEIWRRLTVTA